MARRKSEGLDFGSLLAAIFIEMPLGIWLGMQKPLWQEPPHIIALWVGGFALLFVVIYKIASRRDALSDFLATGRNTIYRKYPKEKRPAPGAGSETPLNPPGAKP